MVELGGCRGVSPMDGSGRKMGGLDSRCIVSFLAPQYYLPQHSAYSNDDEVDDRIAGPP